MWGTAAALRANTCFSVGAQHAGQSLAEGRWLKPELVGWFEFVEWTRDRQQRH
jgi:hypothetical protein